MKTALSYFFIAGLFAGLIAQKAGEVKTFKDKKVKLNVNNLYNISVNSDNNEVQAYTFNKKGKAESILFNSNFTLKEKKEIDFDFDRDRDKKIKEQYGDGVKLEYGKNGYPFLVLQEDVLYIGMKGLGIKLSADANKVGLNLISGTNMFIERGRLIQYTSSYNYGSYGSGSSVNNEFQAQDELKLKSDEDKNMTYEYSKTNGQEFYFRNTSEVSMTTYQKSGESKSLVYSGMYADYYKVYDTYSSHTKTAVKGGAIARRLISGASGDVLLVGKRTNVFKFGKRPDAEDYLPYYYIFQIDARTLDIKAQNKFQEPLMRGIVFRHALSVSGGMLLVSAPVKNAGDKVTPKDENVKRYVFRHFCDDAKMSWELVHEMPSGFTRFLNLVELPDSSMILYAIADSKKADSYFNKKIGVSGDIFYSIKIKNGKVLGSTTLNMEEYYAGYKLPANIKPVKEPFNIQEQELKIVQARSLDDGGIIITGIVTKTDPANGVVRIFGSVLLHFSVNGQLENRFFMPNTSETRPRLDPLTFQTDEHEFLWLTFNSKGGNESLLSPAFTKINLKDKTISPALLVGDKDHVVTSKNPMIFNPETKTMSFFGFDADGEEFWTQNIVLE